MEMAQNVSTQLESPSACCLHSWRVDLLLIYSFVSCFCFNWKSATKLQLPSAGKGAGCSGRERWNPSFQQQWVKQECSEADLAAHVQQRVWSTRVISSLSHSESWPAAPQSVLLSSPLLLLALNLKINQHWSLGGEGGKKALQYILNDKQKQHSHQWHRYCCWCSIACSWLCQLCSVSTSGCVCCPLCVVFTQRHSLHQHLPCRNAAKLQAALWFLCVYR